MNTNTTISNYHNNTVSGFGYTRDECKLKKHYMNGNGEKTNSDNPWKATTLEWQTPTPPPHGNFLTEPKVYHGPYEYSNPDVDNGEDFLAQNDPHKSDSEKQKEAEA